MEQILSSKVLIDHATSDPIGWAILAVTIIAIVLTHILVGNPKHQPLGFSYWWYLINGWLVHWFLDGLNGLWGLSKPFYYLYYIMDPRYYKWDSFLLLVCLLEFFLMFPLCVVVAVLFKSQRHVLREVLAIVVSVLQWVGTVIYLFHECRDGFKNVCPEGSCLSFSTENLLFFWGVFVFANPWWLTIPLYEIYKSGQRLERLLIKGKQN